MTRVIRAHDGSSWSVSLSNVQSLRDLQNTLSSLVSIPPSLMILMHKQGWQIDDQSLDHLLANSVVRISPSGSTSNGSLGSTSRQPDDSNASSASTQDIFCFNRDHLEADFDELEAELTLTASSILRDPPLPDYSAIGHDDPSAAPNLARAYAKTSQSHLDHLQQLLFSLQLQRTALGVALSNLDNHLKGKQGGFDTFELFASPLLDNYNSLLQSYKPSLNLLGQIQVHPQLLMGTSSSAQASHARRSSPEQSNAGTVSPGPSAHGRLPSAASTASGAAGQTRKLSEYVSKDKIAIVKDQCSSAYNDVQAKFTQLHALLDDVHAGAAHLRSEFEADNLDDLSDCLKDSEEAHSRTQGLVRTLDEVRAKDQDDEHQADIFAELALLEREFRERILYLVARKNAATRTLLVFLQHIAALQSDLSQTPLLIRDIDSDLKKRCDNFKYLARLREMAPAYAATLAEIVRRRAYSSKLVTEASDLANVLSKLAETEAKRRNTYRSESAGRLPWDIKGMDSNPDHIELEVRKAARHHQQQASPSKADLLPDVSRNDVEEFSHLLQDLLAELSTDQLDLGGGCVHPLREAHDVLQKQMRQLDALEAEFDKLASAAALEESNSSFASGQQQPAPPPAAATHALQAELVEARQIHEQSKVELEKKLEDAQTRLKKAEDESAEAAASLRDLRQKHATSEQQLSSLKLQHSRQSNQLHTLQADLTVTSSELARAQAAHASAKATKSELENQVRQLTDAKTDLERLLHEERSSSEDHRMARHNLESDLKRLREEWEAESQDSAAKLRKVTEDNQALQVQAAASQSSVDEVLRQVDELKAANTTLSDKERAFQAYKSEAEVDRANLENQLAELRELQQTTAAEAAEHKFQFERLEAEHAVISKRQSSGKGHAAYLPKALGIANAFAQHAQQATSLLTNSTPNLATNAATAAPLPHLPPIAVPKDQDATGFDSQSIEAQLEKIDHLASTVADAFPQAILDHLQASRGTLLRWQKECKVYRQKEKSKIAFHNFKEGDLALFLPTRNTTAQVWAAFNAGFPHYFLKATGSVADQIKTREWIVARITSMEERTADPSDPNGNPFALGSGVKFWLLETEPWSSNSLKSPRKNGGKHHKAKGRSSLQNQITEEDALPNEPPSDRPSPKVSQSLPQTPERKASSSGPSQSTQALDLALSAFSVVDGSPKADGDASPVFTNPDLPSTTKSGLARSLADNAKSEQPPTKELSQPPQALNGLKGLQEESSKQSTAPLSSSPQPAFLPANPHKSSSIGGSMSGRSKAGSYVGRRGMASKVSAKDQPSPPDSAAFTFASLESGGREHRPLRSRKESNRRLSMASSGLGSAENGNPRGANARGSATLAQSYVSSLGRTSGKKEAAAVGSVESLSRSSPSLDLLRRFSTAVESSTGSPVPHLQSGSPSHR